jgi:hypothetical protein
MALTDKLLVAELLLLVALTFGLLVRLGFVRVALVTHRHVRVRDVALSGDGWPERARKLSNSVDNQFQLPLLFYVGVLVTLWLGGAGWLEVILGAIFVVLRFGHALIHIGGNSVPRRFFVYAAGFFVLLAYWLVVAVRVVLA